MILSFNGHPLDIDFPFSLIWKKLSQINFFFNYFFIKNVIFLILVYKTLKMFWRFLPTNCFFFLSGNQSQMWIFPWIFDNGLFHGSFNTFILKVNYCQSQSGSPLSSKETFDKHWGWRFCQDTADNYCQGKPCFERKVGQFD